MDISPTKLRAIKGKIPGKREIGEWSEGKILGFIRFSQHFMKDAVVKKKETQVFDMTWQRWEGAKVNPDEEYWPEFLARLETPDDTMLLRKQRLMMMVRTVGAWLKANPSAITKDMIERMEKNDRWNWVLSTFKMTPEGIVVIDQRETTDPGRANANPNQTNVKTPAVIYQDSLFRLSTILGQLTQGLTFADIKKMPVKDRIQLAEKLTNTLNRAFSGRGGDVNVFKTLVVNNGSKEDLESAMLGYASVNDMAPE